MPPKRSEQGTNRTREGDGQTKITETRTNLEVFDLPLLQGRSSRRRLESEAEVAGPP